MFLIIVNGFNQFNLIEEIYPPSSYFYANLKSISNVQATRADPTESRPASSRPTVDFARLK
jgi:hypothetical protein